VLDRSYIWILWTKHITLFQIITYPRIKEKLIRLYILKTNIWYSCVIDESANIYLSPYTRFECNRILSLQNPIISIITSIISIISQSRLPHIMKRSFFAQLSQHASTSASFYYLSFLARRWKEKNQAISFQTPTDIALKINYK